MAAILFFEKPGCRNNAKQKSLLELSGHHVEAVNLLDYPWTKEELSCFLGEKPLAACFNPAAPSVKSGETEPHAYSRNEAIDAMIRNPILIKRPLMKIGTRCIQGFDTAVLRNFISLVPLPGAESVVKSITMTDMDACPHIADFSCTNQNH
ncbi:MAG: arsenate reductase family protein [Chlorobium limicola]|uniref:Nitrogenase-associated protein n=1 Tax=Chlorobium limicola (strain DSM 245 / NBRC 103803 / 6330) TaxID=290315 RepID=B3EDZ1_CHLL2|nr:ArsC/Spx/MgsR family protein [Chlorobium limicola]ACD90693.1 nitrogenase-associated protein [Chlorobium limicola DSM 245]NTV07855.1 arsenate reductase family protein [Chlorobium limicola]NTV21640.1 arsenate reductase family protein [Chlorobium limicola]